MTNVPLLDLKAQYAQIRAEVMPAIEELCASQRFILGEQVTAVLELQEYYTGGRGGTVDGVLKGLLGRPPITMGRFLEEFAEEFRGQSAKA